MNKDLETKLAQARIKMLMRMPFFGNIALHLPFKDLSSEIETAATDGRFIYYNENFLKDLSADELIFLIAHEVCHAVWQHMRRRESRHYIIWNAACDYVINGMLIEEQVGKFIEKGLHDNKYHGKASEWVYDQLMDEMSDEDRQMLQDMTDCHITLEDDGSVTITTASGKVFKSKEIEGVPKSEQGKLDQHVKTMISQALQAAKSAGRGSGGSIIDLMSELLEPAVDWRSYLCEQISQQVKDDFTFMRPSRKSWGNSFILPGLNDGEHVELTVAIDMSGSTTMKMRQDFVNEIRSIVDMYRSFKLSLMCFDTDIYNYKSFTPENIHDLEDYEFKGNGGTSFEKVFEFLDENEITPEQLVIFTDGYPCDGWGDAEYCPTLFLIHGDSSIKAPFGTTIHYEE